MCLPLCDEINYQAQRRRKNLQQLNNKKERKNLIIRLLRKTKEKKNLNNTQTTKFFLICALFRINKEKNSNNKDNNQNNYNNHNNNIITYSNSALMLEDFPCMTVGQGSYEMHIETNEERQLNSNNNSQSASFTTSLPRFKEVEMPRDKKAIIQLNNSIKLCLETHMSRDQLSPQDLSSHLCQRQNINQSEEDLIQKTESDEMQFSVSTKFVYENDKITSVVLIQIQNQTFNIVNDMFLVNQLENKNNTLSINNPLTKQNLLSLPDDSRKKNQPRQSRKASENSNDSDTTLPLISGNQQQLTAAIAENYRCYQCGTENTISNENCKQTVLKHQTTLTNDTSCMKTLPSSSEISNSSHCNDKANFEQSSVINSQQQVQENQVRSVRKVQFKRKVAMDEEESIFESQKSRLNREEIEQNAIQNQSNIGFAPLQSNSTFTTSTDNKQGQSFQDVETQQQSMERELIQNQSSLLQDNCLKGDYKMVQSSNTTFECRQNQILSSQQVQSESPYASKTGFNNQSEIHSNISSQNQSLILPSITLYNENQIYNDEKHFQFISNQDKSTEKISKTKNYHNSTCSPASLQIIQQNQLNLNQNKENSNMIGDFVNYQNIPQFSCTTFATSPTTTKEERERSNILKIDKIASNQTNKSLCSISNSLNLTNNDQSKESQMFNLLSQETCEEKQDDFDDNDNDKNYQSLAELDDDIVVDISFTDDAIAKTEKKNVVKNFVKAFISYVKREQSALSSIGPANGKSSQAQKLKKFQNYMKKQKFNNQFIKLLISKCDYSSVFQYFMLNKADEWLKNSNVQNKDTHRSMLIFFKKSIADSNELDKLKVLKKNRRIPNSINPRTQQIPSQNVSISATFIPQEIENVSTFSIGDDFQIDYAQVIEDKFNQLIMSSQNNLEENNNSAKASQKKQKQKRNQQTTVSSSIHCIPNVFRDIQINNNSFFISSSDNQNQSLYQNI